MSGKALLILKSEKSCKFEASFKFKGLIENHRFITDLFKYTPFVMRGVDRKRVVSIDEDIPVRYICYNVSYELISELYPLIYSWTKNHRKRLKKIHHFFPDIEMEFYISVYNKDKNWEFTFPDELVRLLADCRIDFGLDYYYAGYYNPSGESNEVNEDNKINFPPYPDANKSDWDNSVDITLNRLIVPGCDQVLINSLEKSGFKYYKDNAKNRIVIFDNCNSILETMETQAAFIGALNDILSEHNSNFQFANLEFESDWLLYKSNRGEIVDYNYFQFFSNFNIKFKLRISSVECCSLSDSSQVSSLTYSS